MIFLVTIGFLGGSFGSLLGVGGAIIMTPFLVVMYPRFGINPSVLSHILFGTNLFVVSFVALFSTFRYHQRGLVLWRFVFPVAASSVIGALTGSFLAANISSGLLLRLFGLVILGAAVKMFHTINVPEDRTPEFTIPALLITGFFSAVIAVMVGIGGAIITIPVMLFVFKFPGRIIPGTSSGIIIFTALAGMAGYMINGWNDPLIPERALGYVYLSAGIPLMAGAISGVPLGTWLNSRISTKRIQHLFGVLMFAAFLKMIVS